LIVTGHRPFDELRKGMPPERSPENASATHSMLKDEKSLKVIYKITYPNQKIYVGQDVTNSIGYFGSPNSTCLAADFTEEQRRSFTVTRDILWGYESANKEEVNAMERHFIVTLRSNDSSIGYNQRPHFKSHNSTSPNLPDKVQD
jgi:hypothetical protein